MRLTKFNEETGQYEYIEKAKTLDEYRAQRKAAIQRLGEFEDMASDVAEEIFAEIERSIFRLETPYQTLYCIDDGFIAELKKKYTEEGK